jgi:hypothetical protein
MAGVTVTVVPARYLVLTMAAIAATAVVVRAVGVPVPVVVLAIVLCVAPPGVLGETSSRTALAALAPGVIALLSAPAEREGDNQIGVALLLIGGGAFALTSFTAHLHSFLPISLVYFAAAIFAWQMSLRPSLARDPLKLWSSSRRPPAFPTGSASSRTFCSARASSG